jgi:hypothetical protein
MRLARTVLPCFLCLAPGVSLLQGCAASSSTVVAAEPQQDSATVAQPPVQPFEPSAPNEIVSDRTKTERSRAVGDMIRLNLATTVEQGPPGVLRVGVGREFHTHQARQYYFIQLASAYYTWRSDTQPLVIELWERGRKIGEYADRAFNIGPDYTSALECPDSATTGLCSGLGQPMQAETPSAPARGQAAVATRPKSGENASRRSGFHAGLGLGAGAMDFAYHGSEVTPETGFSGFAWLAGSVGEKTLLGIEGTGWTKSQSGTTPRVYSLTAQATEYLSTTSGLFLGAGIGLVGYHESTDFGDRSAKGLGFSGRVGYEFGKGRVVLVPYVGIVRTFGGEDMKLDGADAGLNVAISNVQFGLSVTMH